MRGREYTVELVSLGQQLLPVHCPALSHDSATGRTAQVGVDWAFVSPVSLVSSNLKLIENRTTTE
jgi:hypothetical protein